MQMSQIELTDNKQKVVQLESQLLKLQEHNKNLLQVRKLLQFKSLLIVLCKSKYVHTYICKSITEIFCVIAEDHSYIIT